MTSSKQETGSLSDSQSDKPLKDPQPDSNSVCQVEKMIIKCAISQQLLIFLIKLLKQVLNYNRIINLLILKSRLLFLNLLLLI